MSDEVSGLHQREEGARSSTIGSSRAALLHRVVERAWLLEQDPHSRSHNHHHHPRAAQATQILQTPPPTWDHDGNNNAYYQGGPYYHGPPPQYSGGGFGGILPFLGRLFQLLFLWLVVMGVSLFSYLAFYHWSMPSIVASEKLYFDYSETASCAAFPGKPVGSDFQSNVPHNGERQLFGWPPCPSPLPSEVEEELETNGSVPPPNCRLLHPHATVDLLSRHGGAWTALHESVIPHPRSLHRLLVPQQLYLIDVRLRLPDSLHNHHRVGMFAVFVELVSNNGTVLAQSRRSIRYPHRTPWIAAARQGIRILPLVVGAADETTELALMPFRHFAESQDLPLRTVRVVLLPGTTMTAATAAADGGSNPPAQHPEVVAGHLLVGEELTAFQEVLREWYGTCLVVGVHLFAAFYLVLWQLVQVFICVCRNFFSSGTAGAVGEEEDDPEENESDPPCDLDLDGSVVGGGGDDDDDEAAGGVADESVDATEDAGEGGGAPPPATPGSDPRGGGRRRGRRRRRRRSSVVVDGQEDFQGSSDDDHWEELPHRRRHPVSDDDGNDHDDDGDGGASFATPPQPAR